MTSRFPVRPRGTGLDRQVRDRRLAGRAAAEVPEGESGALAPERRAVLEEIDPWW